MVAVAVIDPGVLLMQHPRLSPAGDAVRVAHIVLLAAAAAGLAQGRARRADPLIRWLSVALGLSVLVELQLLAGLPRPATDASVRIHVLQLAGGGGAADRLPRRGSPGSGSAEPARCGERAAADGAGSPRRARSGCGVHREPVQVPRRELR
jgi:hypothetical protein